MAKDDVGRIYLVHLEVPLGDDGNGGRSRAQHYTGWAKNVRSRLMVHRRAWPDTDHRGAKLLAYANALGVAWRVVDIRRGTYEDEKRMKFNGRAWRRCPVCNPKLAQPGEETTSMKVHESGGNVGIASMKLFRFHCGGCNVVTETFAANLEDAKDDARDLAWTNGHRRDLSVNGAGYSVESTWRCGECRREMEEAARAEDPVPVGVAAGGEEVPDDEAWDDIPF